jgi:flavin reductase (DIM6/NTAB) family NADH-FMN oxidoreductase RutF
MSEHSGVEAFIGGLNYTMLVVTCRADDQPAGCLVGFTTQTSIDPPRFLVCLSRTNVTTRVAARAEHLAVHQLGREDVDLARLFGEHTAEDENKFTRCAWTDGPHGVPILDRAVAWMVGRVLSIGDGGDHAEFLLEPVDGHRRRYARALMFTDLPHLDPGQEA